MPLLKSSIKKYRQSVTRRKRNLGVREKIKTQLHSFRQKPTPTSHSKLSSLLDKAVKTGILHKNKASRLKSRLAKLLKK